MNKKNKIIRSEKIKKKKIYKIKKVVYERK